MILEKIVDYTRLRVEAMKEMKSIDQVKQEALELVYDQEKKGEVTFVFEEALKEKGVHVICEVKKASPSKGILSSKFDYLSIAKDYERIGASAISVLTEPAFFQGSDSFLVEIKQQVSLPILRKDFMVDEYQLYESKVLGASCVLLICAVLSEEQLVQYLTICNELYLSAIVETHSLEEVHKALRVGARMIGVNNRNLMDFSEHLSTSIELRKEVPKEIIFISESGIRTKHDMCKLYEAGICNVLVGEAFMRTENKKKEFEELLSLCKLGEKQ